jgi:hypothetical protein
MAPSFGLELPPNTMNMERSGEFQNLMILEGTPEDPEALLTFRATAHLPALRATRDAHTPIPP